MTEKLLLKVIEEADKNHDGHFTLMKFTTNWRACYGTVTDRFEIDFMLEGKTKDEVLQKLLDRPLNILDEDIESPFITSLEDMM